MSKANTDYGRLADETEVLVDGFTARTTRTRNELNRLLKDVPERAAVVQVIERHARNLRDLEDAKARLDRYVALRDRPEPAASEAPTS